VSLQESAKRAVRPLKQKKDPVSIEMLLELCNMHFGNNDLLVVRDLIMILLSFAGFLRFDDISDKHRKWTSDSFTLSNQNLVPITILVGLTFANKKK
jgi:hypothetical protein